MSRKFGNVLTPPLFSNFLMQGLKKSLTYNAIYNRVAGSKLVKNANFVHKLFHKRSNPRKWKMVKLRPNFLQKLVQIAKFKIRISLNNVSFSVLKNRL